MLSDVYQTITKPFREPMSMGEFLLWAVIYIVIAFALWDVLRILRSFLESAVEG